MLLFRSEDDIVAWCHQRHVAPGAVVDLAGLWSLAAVWYNDRLDPAWRRRTIPERQAIVDSVGRTGAFLALRGS